FTDKNDADMGYYSAMPSIVKLRIDETDRWVAIFGNGYNNKAADGQASSTGNAVIYIVDLFTGALLKKLDSGSGNQATYSSNAMAQPLIVDSTGSGRADTIYAGDLYGNLWKFDVSRSSTDEWKSSLLNGNTPIPLFTASSGQTITSRPAVTRSAAGGQLVMFGTGKFIETSDKQIAGATTQSIYAIRDNNTTTTITKDSNLIQQVITGTTTVDGKNHRVVTNAAVDWATNNGWYLDLIQTGSTNKGERVVVNPWVYDNTLYVTTLLPDPDTCGYGGKSWYMQFDVRTGQLQQSEETMPPAMGLESGSVITGKPDPAPEPDPDDEPPTPTPDPLVTASAAVCKNNGVGNTVLFNYVKQSDGTIRKIPTEIQCNGLVSWQELY
ncbi:MAG: pilus assembly protein, partial [Aeromonadaceae bacterium]